ncbi:MAG: putative rRNA maturation factor [Candidatus Woesebacteria bacterium GW2011_GWA1_39_8]|nr:MAG: putative rRNA maturation factor [Candidatus Woesebacteria bacterium GW2011_GWA1_39_8]
MPNAYDKQSLSQTMFMIRVYVKKQGNFAVNTPKVKKKLQEYFIKAGIVSNADVSLSIVGEKKMISLAHTYLKENNIVHNVLSFPFMETDTFVEPPDNVIHLGDIIICYPKVVDEAKSQGRLIDDKVIELAEHGAAHLLGEHHE